jgi:hypothetical protein
MQTRYATFPDPASASAFQDLQYDCMLDITLRGCRLYPISGLEKADYLLINAHFNDFEFSVPAEVSHVLCFRSPVEAAVDVIMHDDVMRASMRRIMSVHVASMTLTMPRSSEMASCSFRSQLSA